MGLPFPTELATPDHTNMAVMNPFSLAALTLRVAPDLRTKGFDEAACQTPFGARPTVRQPSNEMDDTGSWMLI